MGDLVLITPATIMPVTLYEAKLQCGLGPDDDADTLRSMQVESKMRRAIASATRMVENELSRKLMTQTWVLTRGRFPRGDAEYTEQGYPAIMLPYPPLQEIVSFQYTDLSGATQTVPSTTYALINGGEEASRIVLYFQAQWPINIPMPSSLQITFTCGYASSSDVPASITQAVLLLTEFFFLNPQSTPLPAVIKNLLDPERNRMS